MKSRDFVVLVRNGVEINALVVASQMALATQRADIPRSLRPPVDGSPVEQLTVVYYEPKTSTALPSGSQVIDGIRTEYNVLPLAPGGNNGWKPIVDVDAETERIEGSPREAQKPLSVGVGQVAPVAE